MVEQAAWAAWVGLWVGKENSTHLQPVHVKYDPTCANPPYECKNTYVNWLAIVLASSKERLHRILTDVHTPGASEGATKCGRLRTFLDTYFRRILVTSPRPSLCGKFAIDYGKMGLSECTGEVL